jgi:transketolase
MNNKIISGLKTAVYESQREALGEIMLEAGRKNPKVIAITADVADSTRLLKFHDEFPGRFYDMGVSEQAMIGVCAGLSNLGLIPFGAMFGAFEAGRAYDHIRVSIGINRANVTLVGSHVGFSNPGDGVTAQSLTDIALMKSIPNMTIVCPADTVELKKAIMMAVDFVGPLYIRISRDATPVFTTQESSFSFSKADVIKEGSDITIVGVGPIIYNAIIAAEELEKENIKCELIDCHTIKPLDGETILKSVRKTRAVVTLEEHTIVGGAGEDIGRLLLENMPVPVEFVGVRDRNGQSARIYDELIDNYGLGADSIMKAARNVLKRKK